MVTNHPILTIDLITQRHKSTVKTAISRTPPAIHPSSKIHSKPWIVTVLREYAKTTYLFSLHEFLTYVFSEEPIEKQQSAFWEPI